MMKTRQDVYLSTAEAVEKTPLIDLRKVIRGAGRRRILPALAAPVGHLLAIDRANELYRSLPAGLNSSEFCRKTLEALRIEYAVTDGEMVHIPKKGALITVANHPFGGIDGIILAELLLQVRDDFKILGNSWLTRIPELAEKIIPVNPFNPGRAARQNASGIRAAMSWLERGGALLTFPAGEVSHLRPGAGGISDPPWIPHVARLARAQKARILPVYIHGRNSMFFQLAGLIHPRLRTILLAREMFNKHASAIQVSVGHAIAWSRLADFSSDQEMTAFIRYHTYLLRHRIEDKQGSVTSRRNTLRSIRKDPVVAPVPKKALLREIELLPPRNLLVSQNGYRVYITMADESPAVMREIGRLREISFRLVGEGTGRSIDIDRFDGHYRQLFLWDNESQEIIGAYRIGLADRILSQQGRAGLYSATLFDYKAPFFNILGNAMELGRSFIRDEYQRKFGCLSLLWRGIGELVARNPHYRYLFGPVSISQNYHRISKNMMVEFLSRHMQEPTVAPLVKPRCPHKGYWPIERGNRLGSEVQLTLEDISMLVSELEKDRKGIPVLVKHYLKLNGKFLAFNVDKSFSNAIDGLVFVDLIKTEPKLLQRFLGVEGLTLFLNHHTAAYSTLAA
jgi:putative hemolysin